jgi:hypothetical protein
MPMLGAARQLSLEAATTFSNSYGIGFEATGDVTGLATFTATGNPLTAGNSGTAFLAAMTSFDAGSAGVLSAVSGLSSMVATAGTDAFITRQNSDINLSGAIGTPNIRPVPVVSGLVVGGGGSSSTVAASLIGTNTGTERLQVSGRIGENVTNDLRGPGSDQIKDQLTAF